MAKTLNAQAALEESRKENERLRTGIEEIQDHAARNMRLVAGQPHGPLAMIADMARALLPVFTEKGTPDD